MNANGVAVRVENHRHAARRTIHRLHAEFYLAVAQLFYRRVEVLDFQRGAAAVGTRLEHSGRTADGQRIRAEFVFDPLVVFGIRDGCGFQVQHAFVKRAGAFHVGDGVTTKCQFDDLHDSI
jgi:hypothetical protein